jgi:hypothetical protein
MKLSAVDQELLDLTEDFTLEDWDAIRTPDHWQIRDGIRGTAAKNEFLLKEVKKYLWK